MSSEPSKLPANDPRHGQKWGTQQLKHWIFALYDRALDVIVIGLVFVMLVLLVLSFADVLLNLKGMIVTLVTGSGGETEFHALIGNVLDVFVVMELFNTFMGYVRTRHVRLSALLDVTIVFALREMLIKLYDKQAAIEMLAGLAAIILVLVIARTLTARYSPVRGDKR
ncbi:MAG: hypothetical protein EPN74_08075 [Rhodanobacter sp.]|nr:MAG: hypothetical protein EPN74_08075 [Rhodanobacter sp.]